MDAAFTSIPFADSARADANLERLERSLPANLWATLPALLAQLPDPDGALNFLERYLQADAERAAAGAAASIVSFLKRHPAALHHLLVIFSYSRFLSESLVQEPSLILWLDRPARRGAESPLTLDRIKSPEDLREELARFGASGLSESVTDSSPAVLLSRFKRREYLRITLRDVLGLATLAETTLELSHLADVLLEHALRVSVQKLHNLYGAPQFTDARGLRHPVRLAILSLGKLGGQELNYNSDIDLMFLYGHDGETSGGSAGAISNAEFFVRLAQTVLKLITGPAPEGAVYRIDLRLRPQGHEGELATSVATALDYYRARAQQWELQMLIKARCSAGDPECARPFLRELQPLIYRREFHLAAVEAVLGARKGMTRDLRLRAGATPHSAEWNVKLSPGGIRDIEFLTQCLQRLYGGSDSWLRVSSTLVSLQRLHDKGRLSGRDFFRLSNAYQFLRRVEHRLQLRDGLPRHTLPQDPAALERLARRCGIESAPAGGRTAADQLFNRLAQHFAEVREIYDRTLARQSSDRLEPAKAQESDPTVGALLQRLRIEFPRLATRFEAHLSSPPGSAGDGEEALARRGLLHFLDSAVLDSAVMTQLESHPEWLDHAAELLMRSDLVGEILARNPEQIALLAGSDAVALPDSVQSPADHSPEQEMAALRVRYRHGALATVVRALLGATQPFETFEALSRLAEHALTRTLAVFAREVSCSAVLESAPFAVLALGRLGTAEMDIGSDADLAFVADDALTVEEREPWRRLAERFVFAAGSHTREGILFPVDTRLRPRGTEGDIVQSLGSFCNYFRADARAWEAATYLKARPIAGNLALGAEAIHRIHAVVRERFSDPRELAGQLADTRARLEKEAGEAPRNLAAKGEFKKVAGGYYDIEYILAFLLLTRGPAAGAARGSRPEAPGHVLRQIALLESSGVLGTANAQSLRAAALFYRSLDHALRLVTGRPANRLPEPALAMRVRRLLEIWKLPLQEGLNAAVEATRSRTRALYNQLLPG